MAYTVTVLFDHMLEDETHYFENEADALKYKKVVPVIDVLAIQRDCERVGIALADVYPRQIALF
ncbi:hypothetical protein HCC27_08825 [Streptococcus suis]|uniref:DUF7204 family protein n=1 Tax=Streptococcus suis TaxID=1307 RepID=UPI0004002A9A|nr:hypothetical protein [Streptococcus suis]MCK3921931.1 hypothetical protein [Streptococcus suis]NQG50921.1 hypothetical protein [Streptococcus suis]NQI28360.1 hypothetical protein [Streptococcus suis]UUM54436.1 hypothetical protein NQZ92_04845 [Streptococcus suis]CYT97978.1 Uncharacterised protein [Streptococcus suis]